MNDENTTEDGYLKPTNQYEPVATEQDREEKPKNGSFKLPLYLEILNCNFIFKGYRYSFMVKYIHPHKTFDHC